MKPLKIFYDPDTQDLIETVASDNSFPGSFFFNFVLLFFQTYVTVILQHKCSSRVNAVHNFYVAYVQKNSTNKQKKAHFST